MKHEYRHKPDVVAAWLWTGNSADIDPASWLAAEMAAGRIRVSDDGQCLVDDGGELARVGEMLVLDDGDLWSETEEWFLRHYEPADTDTGTDTDCDDGEPNTAAPTNMPRPYTRWRHRTSPHTYTVTGSGWLKCDQAEMDTSPIVLYTSDREGAEGMVFARPLVEWCERFTPAPPPDYRAAFAKLREASAGCWDGVDPDAYVAEIRGRDVVTRAEHEALVARVVALEERTRPLGPVAEPLGIHKEALAERTRIVAQLRARADHMYEGEINAALYYEAERIERGER